MMKWDFFTFSFVFIGAGVVKLLGGYDPMLQLLLFIILGDIISGVMGGIYRRELNSIVMFNGSIKKMSIMLVIVIAVQVDLAFSNSLPLREIVIVYYIGQEGISFIENISKFTSLPTAFTKYFKNIEKDDEK